MRLYAFEVHKRRLPGIQIPAPVRQSQDVAALVAQVLGPIDREVMLVLHFDAKNRLRGITEAGRGGLVSCAVSPMEIFRAALIHGAAAIVLSHNHPSGDPTPSVEDVAMTAQVIACGQILGVRVLDHLIVGDDGRHFSMLDAGCMPAPDVASFLEGIKR